MNFFRTPKGFINPFTLMLEGMGLIQKKLVGQYDVANVWDNDLITEHGGFERERLVFFLFEYPSGRRTYQLLQYGYSEQVDAGAAHLPEVMVWVHGGAMPEAAKRIAGGGKGPEIVKLALVKGGPGA